MEDISKLDLYGLLEIPLEAQEKEIKRAYRKKALGCHPDKNRDNPKAVELFHQLSKALELLTDPAARAAYDRVLKSRQAAELRNKALDSKRKKFKADLEAGERLHRETNIVNFDAATQLQNEIERLRKEGSRLVEEEQMLLREQLLKEQEKKVPEFDFMLPRIKMKWRVTKETEANDYTYDTLQKLFSKYGEISCLVLSNSKKGNALVEFMSTSAAETAFKHEKGHKSNPLKLSWAQGKPSVIDPLFKDSKFTGYQPSAEPMSSNSSITERDYESLVLMKMRQAEERKLLIEKMMKDDTDN